MKWTTTTLLIVFLAQGLLAPSSGGGVSMNVWRNPFPQTSSLYWPTINITHPIEDKNYSKATLDVNVTVLSALPPHTCYYRIGSNSWNNLTCNQTQHVTFPQGSNTLTVKVVDGRGYEGYDSVTFYIFKRPGVIPSEIPPLIVIMSFSIWPLLWYGWQENKKKQK